MSNTIEACEIVESFANHKKFLYCRTHKSEALCEALCLEAEKLQGSTDEVDEDDGQLDLFPEGVFHPDADWYFGADVKVTQLEKELKKIKDSFSVLPPEEGYPKELKKGFILVDGGISFPLDFSNPKKDKIYD